MKKQGTSPLIGSSSVSVAQRKSKADDEHWIVELYSVDQSVNPEAAARHHLQMIVRDLKAGKPLHTVHRERLVEALNAELIGKPFAKAFGLHHGQATRLIRTLARNAWIAMDYELRKLELPAGTKRASIEKAVAQDWNVSNKHSRAKPSRGSKDRESTVAEAVRKFASFARRAIAEETLLRLEVYQETDAEVLARFRKRIDQMRGGAAPKK